MSRLISTVDYFNTKQSEFIKIELTGWFLLFFFENK